MNESRLHLEAKPARAQPPNRRVVDRGLTEQQSKVIFTFHTLFLF
jgi:hypothetical protein